MLGRWLRRIGVVFVIGLTVGTRVSGQELPTLTAPVTDLAHVIDADSAARLDARIRELQKATGDVVVVATVPSFAPYGSIEEYAVKLFERAGIGQREQSNGLLVVLALAERRVRVEVGYGLEEFITDGFAGETIRQSMLPRFRDGRYGAGLEAGTNEIIRRIAERRNVTLTGLPPEPATSGRAPDLSAREIFIMFVVLMIILRAMRSGGGPSMRGRGGRRGTWSGWHGGVGGFGGGLGGFGGGFGGGHGGGGGFGGFGGGRSGGGGASGGW